MCISKCKGPNVLTPITKRHWLDAKGSHVQERSPNYYGAFNGNLEILKYSYENSEKKDCELLCYDNEISKLCLNKDSVECLEYAIKNKAEYGVNLVDYAIINNKIKCLKYLYSIGCIGDVDTFYQATKNGNYKCLEFLIENNCPYDNKSIEYIIKYKKSEENIYNLFLKNKLLQKK